MYDVLLYKKNKMDIFDFISQDAFIVYNKTLAKTIWINETIIFMYFISQYKRFIANSLLWEDWYFYKKSDDIYENTWLSRAQQKTAMDNLQERGLIDYKLKWVPPILHFKIFRDMLQTLFSSNFEESWKLIFNKAQNWFSTKSKIIYNNKYNNINNNKKEKTLSKDNGKPLAFWNKEINFIIETIKKFNNWIVDWTVKEQRQYWKMLLDKLNKIESVVDWKYKANDILEIILKVISKNKFHSHKIVWPKKIFYELAGLMQVCKQDFEKENGKKMPFIPWI